MKSLSVLLLLFCITAKAENNCQTVTCGELSKDKRDCVLKEDCEPQVKRLKAKIAKLEEENKRLKAAPIVVRREVVVEEADITRHNVSLLGGESYDSYDIKQVDKDTIRISNHRKFDAGLMYQYNFSRKIRGSILGTLNGVGLLGLGLNF